MTIGPKRDGEKFGHKCYGCGREIADYEEHIHLGLDEWSTSKGMETFGLDDLFTFPFCSKCIVPSERGKIPEAHAIEAAS